MDARPSNDSLSIHDLLELTRETAERFEGIREIGGEAVDHVPESLDIDALPMAFHHDTLESVARPHPIALGIVAEIPRYACHRERLQQSMHCPNGYLEFFCESISVPPARTADVVKDPEKSAEPLALADAALGVGSLADRTFFPHGGDHKAALRQHRVIDM